MLAYFLVLLGAKVGKKNKVANKVPIFVKNGSSNVKREYLCGLADKKKGGVLRVFSEFTMVEKFDYDALFVNPFTDFTKFC